MASSSSSESSTILDSLATKLRSELLHHFDSTDNSQSTSVKFTFRKRSAALDIEFYSVNMEDPNSPECCCMVLPAGTTDLETERYFRTAKEASNTGLAMVPRPLIWQKIEANRPFILFRAQKTQRVDSLKAEIFAALHKLHELSVASDSQNAGFGTDPNKCQTWQRWFTTAMATTLQDMAKIGVIQTTIQSDVILKLTNHLLGAIEYGSARPGLVHQNLFFDNVASILNRQGGGLFFHDAVYFYGPAEWILTTGAGYGADFDFEFTVDPIFAKPEQYGKDRLKLYIAYKNMRTIALQDRLSEESVALLSKELNQLADRARSLGITG